MAVLIGVSAGLIVSGFKELIFQLQQLFWGYGFFYQTVADAPLWRKILVPAGVGAVVVFLASRFSREAEGHGVPEVMDAVARKNGFIRVRVALVKTLASAMSIASGASVGRVGPIVQIGSSFGSIVGQLFQVSSRRMKTFIGCGAAAGIAATFNAPIAGAIFASEVILGDFSVASIGPIIVASVFGTVISRSIEGDFPAFTPPMYSLQSPWELIFYAILGILVGLAGWLFIKTLYLAEDGFDRWRVPNEFKAIIGGAILGGLASFMPHTMGVGLDTIDLVLVGALPVIMVTILIFAKILATSLSLGYGASGGVFAPSLFIGAMLGSAFGLYTHSLFPAITASSGAYALVGMAAMVAATTNAPVTAVLIIFEMTSEYSVILPLMIASILATIITSKLQDGTIYTLKLKRRGIDISGGRDRNVLDRIEVEHVKQLMVKSVQDDLPLASLLQLMAKSKEINLYVLDEEGVLEGIITQNSVRRFLDHHEQVASDTVVKEVMNVHFETITDSTPLHHALRLMTQLDLEALPVVDNQGKLTGQVERSGILEKYQEQLLKSQSAQAIATSMKYIHRHDHEEMEVMPGFLMAKINPPSRFIGRSIMEMNVRKKHRIEILLIRRVVDGENQDRMPVATDKMQQDDQLIIFGDQERVEKFCKLD